LNFRATNIEIFGFSAHKMADREQELRAICAARNAAMALGPEHFDKKEAALNKFADELSRFCDNTPPDSV